MSIRKKKKKETCNSNVMFLSFYIILISLSSRIIVEYLGRQFASDLATCRFSVNRGVLPRRLRSEIVQDEPERMRDLYDDYRQMTVSVVPQY